METNTETTRSSWELALKNFCGLSFTGMNTRNNLVTVHLRSQTNDYKADCTHIIVLAEQKKKSETLGPWSMIKIDIKYIYIYIYIY